MIVGANARSLLTPPHERSRWWAVLLVSLLSTVGTGQHGPSPEIRSLGRQAEPHSMLGIAPQRNVVDLPVEAQMHISQAVGHDDFAYHVRRADDGYRVDAPSHGVSAEFSAAGAEFSLNTHHWRLALREYGYEETTQPVVALRPVAKGNRVEYHRGAMTEWYVNGPLGIEQGFTLQRPPEGPNRKPLTLGFELSGNLTASVSPDARTVMLVNDGVTVLRYAGLAAWDADGRDVPAWLETNDDRLYIRVDDNRARYPLTIDPFVQAARLSTVKPCDPNGVCDDGAPGDAFGLSLSISADASTVVVGVPNKYTNSMLTGAAYVFVRPGDHEGGWNSIYPIHFKAKLIASDVHPLGRRLGFSVDISRDGGTIVAGALGAGPDGAGYVFVRPSTGWGTYPVQTQTAKLTALFSSTGQDSGTFGQSVTISGDGATIAVGAPNYEVASVNRGAAFVYLRPAGGWSNATESQKLIGSVYSVSGWSVALSDDATTLVVGGINENPRGGTANGVGAAHVFLRRFTPGAPVSYADAARLGPSDGERFDFFGSSVVLSGDGSTIVVAAPVNADETPPHAGAVYVFVRPRKGWGAPKYSVAEAAKLTASDGWESNQFGRSVAISADGKTIAAGGLDVPPLPGSLVNPGIAYFFERPAAGWTTSTETTKMFTPEWVDGREWFGYSASLSGDGRVAVIGAPFLTIDANVAQGAAYVLTGSARLKTIR